MDTCLSQVQGDMSSDLMAQFRFLLTDVLQVLKLVIIISAPIAIVVAIGIWIYLKRIKPR
jgi:hypothetical protein